VLIHLADSLDFRLRAAARVERLGALPGVPPEAALVVRAARMLARDSSCELGVDIGVRKRIPMGGGLGGGSSDAATTLLALNRLWDLNWPRERLAALGLRLGADVPVFLFGRGAYATGVGERLRPISLPRRWYVVVAPPIAVSTASVFSAPELTRNTKPLRISGLSRGNQVFRGGNDLQDVVVARHPEVAAALEALRQAARDVGCDPRAVRMTGSGACVFLPAEGESQAERVRDRLDGRVDAQVLVSRSLAAHPLRDWAFVSAPPRQRGGEAG